MDLQDILEELISTEDIITYQQGIRIQMMYEHVVMNFYRGLECQSSDYHCPKEYYT